MQLVAVAVDRDVHRHDVDLVERVGLLDEFGNLRRGCEQSAVAVRCLQHDVVESAVRRLRPLADDDAHAARCTDTGDAPVESRSAHGDLHYDATPTGLSTQSGAKRRGVVVRRYVS